MALSRPLMSLASFYLEQIFNHPLRTQSITSASSASFASLISQLSSSKNPLNIDNVLVYTAFGALLDGPISYYFHSLLDRCISDNQGIAIVKKLLLERLGFYPLYLALALYVLARLERKTHNGALGEVFTLYSSLLHDNWKYLTPVHIVAFTAVPPLIRLQFLNIANFLWIIHVAYKRRQSCKTVKK